MLMEELVREHIRSNLEMAEQLRYSRRLRAFRRAKRTERRAERRMLKARRRVAELRSGI